MSEQALSVDLYQLTTLIAHAAEGRLSHKVGMSFFFRRMPRGRNYVVAAGLRSIMEHCEALRIDGLGEMTAITHHPVLREAFRTPAGSKVFGELQGLDGFDGDIDAVPEGTPVFAGPAFDAKGRALHLPGGQRLVAYTPMVQVRTGLMLAKLIETPWLSRLNYLSMVASKAARVVSAAGERPVLEFGQRRTHPDAAVDAAYAAYIAGCQGTSNLRATYRYGIPSFGTMDHFAIQASERAGVPLLESEAAFFARFCELFPGASTLLVDTYDTRSGIVGAVRSTRGRCAGIRIDSNATPRTLHEARQLLRALGAPDAKIFVSDGLDEWRVRQLAPHADGFGVGENITCSPDSATGIGAVGKLVVNGYGKPTMKVSRGSGKATLPGMLQAYRFPDRDLLCLEDEPYPGGIPLLQPAWRGRTRISAEPADAVREWTRAALGALPDSLLGLEESEVPRPIWLSDGLAELVQRMHAETREQVDSSGGAATPLPAA